MVGERIASLLDELGIDRAHLVYGSFGEDAVHQLLRARPSSVASVTALLPRQADAVVTEEFPGPVSALFAANTFGGRPRPARRSIGALAPRFRICRRIIPPSHGPTSSPTGLRMCWRRSERLRRRNSFRHLSLARPGKWRVCDTR